jgi:hypothetical protein
MSHDVEHPESTQIRTYVPDDQYGVIRELAAARRVSISQIVRELIAAGLQKDALDSAAAEAMETVTSALDHLERLLFFAAQQAALTAVGQEQSARMATRQAAPNDPERAQRLFDAAIGELQKIAHERLRQALHGRNPVHPVAETGEASHEV